MLPVPERRNGDKILSTLPSEMYLQIFEHIAPTTGRLTPEELETLSTLSRVCRFFAGVCLPHIFEYVEFSCNDAERSSGLHGTILGALCTDAVAKQHLALSLVKMVRVCHFTDWDWRSCKGRWPAELTARMRNIRELKFSNSALDYDHWFAIKTLGSLDELSFNRCTFLRGPFTLDGRQAKLKVSRLHLTYCNGTNPFKAIDARCLRTLVMDLRFAKVVDWVSLSALRELHFYRPEGRAISTETVQRYYSGIPLEVLRSLEVLRLFIDIPRPMVRGIVKDISNMNLPLLRSLTLHIDFHYSGICKKPTTVSRTSSSSSSGCLTYSLGRFFGPEVCRRSPSKSAIVRAEKFTDHTGDLARKDSTYSS